MKIGKYGIYPHHTEHTGAHNYNNGGCKALSYTAAGCNGAIHKSAESIGEAHYTRALKSRLNYRLIIGKQG